MLAHPPFLAPLRAAPHPLAFWYPTGSTHRVRAGATRLWISHWEVHLLAGKRQVTKECGFFRRPRFFRPTGDMTVLCRCKFSCAPPPSCVRTRSVTIEVGLDRHSGLIPAIPQALSLSFGGSAPGIGSDEHLAVFRTEKDAGGRARWVAIPGLTFWALKNQDQLNMGTTQNHSAIHFSLQSL